MKQLFGKTLLTLTLLSPSVYAFDNGSTYSFIGVQGSVSDYDGISTPTLALKYGQQSSAWRTAISYNFAQNSDDQFQSLIAQVDYGVLTELFAELPLKPYVGFSLGMIQHANDTNSIDTDYGYLYGLNGGINYVLNNDFDIDLGYRYMRTNKLESLDSMSDIMLSLHYYFD